MRYYLIPIFLMTWALSGFMAGCGSETGPAAPKSATQPQTARDGQKSAPSKPKVVEVMPNTNLEKGKILERENAGLQLPPTGGEDLDEVVIPGEKPGEKGLTRRELEALIKSRNQGDILDEKADITMDKPGSKGMTWRELEKLIQTQNQADILDSTSGHNDTSGAASMTWRELEQHIKNMPQANPLDVESGLTETPGGKPLTFREVERLVETQAQTLPRETANEPEK